MRLWGARRAAILVLFLAGLLGVAPLAWGQFANKTGNVVGTAGGACSSTTNDYAWPDTNGNVLKCVANVWTPVAIFWTNANTRVGIGSSSPVVTLDASQATDAIALPVGTTGQEPASPLNGMIRYNTTLNDLESYINGAWTTLTTGGSTAAITLGTSAATPDPYSSYSATTGLFSPASGVTAISAAGTEKMRVNATGVGIGSTSPAATLDIGGGTITTNVPAINIAQTWNASGTTFDAPLYMAITNTASASASRIIDLHVGAFSEFSVDASGYVYPGEIWFNQGNRSKIYSASDGQIDFANSAATKQLIITLIGSGSYNLGAADAAAPVAQTLGVQNVVAGTSNTAGANFTITGSQGTGTGAGGAIVFQTAPAGSTGTAQNALAEAMRITSAGYVGIGTTTPNNLLTINGAVDFGTVYTTSGQTVRIAPSNSFSEVSIISQGAGISLFANPQGSTQTSWVGKTLPASGSGIMNTAGGEDLILSAANSSGGGVSIMGYHNGAAHDIKLFNDGSEQMRLTNGGLLGIGTSVPDNILSLGGQSARTIDMVRETTASTAGNNLTVSAGGAVSGGTDLAGGNLVLSSGISTGTNTSNIQFQTYPAAGSTSSSDNTATVAATLSATGSASGGTEVTTLQGTAGSGSNVNGGNVTIASGVSTGTGSSSMNFNVYKAGSTGSTANAATTAMTITGAGFVGIGITNPSYPLQVNSASAGTTIVASVNGSYRVGMGPVTGGGYGGVELGSGQSIVWDNGTTLGGTPDTGLSRGTAGVLYVDSTTTNGSGTLIAGSVGIGTNAPAYLLHVGSASASGIVEELQNSSGNCTFQPSSSALQVICSSDRRLKEDIDDAVPALPQLADMRVRNYTIKASGERTIGVIAQEMIFKHPDLVHMGPDGFYGVEAPNVWLLVKAIQELDAVNDDLAARVSADDDAVKQANDNIADLRESFEAYKAAHP